MKTSDFEDRKQASLAHQLIKAGRLLNEHGLAAARIAFKLPELKQTHLDLFPHIDFAGTSISDIAKRKGVSKQAVSKLVQEMIKMKLVYLEDDPNDSRTKRVFFYTRGPYAISKGFSALEVLDKSLKQQLGEHGYRLLLKKVDDIHAILSVLEKD